MSVTTFVLPSIPNHICANIGIDEPKIYEESDLDAAESQATDPDSESSFNIIPQADKKNKTEQEFVRLDKLLEQYYNTKRFSFEEVSFGEMLDELEIMEVVQNTHSNTLEEAKKSLREFHASWQKINIISKTPMASILNRPLGDLLDVAQLIQQLIWRLEDMWYRSSLLFLGRLEQHERKILDDEREIGRHITMADAFLKLPREVRDYLLSIYQDLREIYSRFQIDKYHSLKNRLRIALKHLSDRVANNPEVLRSILMNLHLANAEIYDEILDELFGINAQAIENGISFKKFDRKYGNEQYFYQGTPYNLIRKFLIESPLGKEDRLYDLGSGLGRVVFYAASVGKGKFKGIEIVPDRVVEARRIKDRLKLDNVEFIRGNVLDFDYSDGTIFFLFNPFTMDTLRKVGKRLQEIAAQKKIKIVSIGDSSRYFENQDWLKKVKVKSGNAHWTWNFAIFESQ